ncbi:MAG TPA: YebC/PmpR family DNA-binding transcriptional regulator [Candidatus Gastranaerophilaceae bacterium]|nr:YebC/PmpR family DNA-binding transcriptional regulator [Candidatus Gastranaerophilaceae bacterium]
MSGHSKWATIKRKKAKVDSARAVVFQKYSRELMVSARLGGADSAANFRLRTAIDRAKSAGLPADNIKRAIEKGAGLGSAENFEELTYEGYGAGGVAIFIEALTDNRNRTAGDIRSYFTKYNGNLGENGCVGWMFKPVGIVSFSKLQDFEKLFDAAADLGADDVMEDDENYKVITSVENFQSVVEGLEKSGFKNISAELTRLPQNSIEITDEKIASQILKLLERIEEHDDVQNVYSNFDIADDILQKIE